MKIQQLQNAVEAFDFDVFSDEHIPALGKVLADKQVVVVKQKLTEERHYDILDSWGSPGMSPVIYGIGTGKLKGLHWNAVRNTTARIGKLINPLKSPNLYFLSVTFAYLLLAILVFLFFSLINDGSLKCFLLYL